MDNDPSSYWTISIRNHANLAITDVQFPFVVAPYDLGGKPGSEALLQPLMTGRFFAAPKPDELRRPGGGRLRREDLDHVAVFELALQRDQPAVDPGADAAVAHLGVHGVGEVHRRRPGGQRDHVALRA